MSITRSQHEMVTFYFSASRRGGHKIAVRRLWFFLSLVLLIFSAAFYRVWQDMQVIKNGYLLQQTKQNYMQLRQEYHALLAQRNALASYERIEDIARTELQLDAPREDQLQFILDPAVKNAARSGWRHFWDWLTPR